MKQALERLPSELLLRIFEFDNLQVIFSKVFIHDHDYLLLAPNIGNLIWETYKAWLFKQIRVVLYPNGKVQLTPRFKQTVSFYDKSILKIIQCDWITDYIQFIELKAGVPSYYHLQEVNPIVESLIKRIPNLKEYSSVGRFKLKDLPNIQSIRLSGSTYIKALSRWAVTNLELINGGNILYQHQNLFDYLNNLRLLTIVNCVVNRELKLQDKKCPHLESLTIKSCGLESSGIQIHLLNLETVNLSSNKLSNLEGFYLPSLVVADFSSNSLGAIPKQIDGWNKLQSLNLSCNRILLMNNIGNLKKLTKLYLQRNLIKTIGTIDSKKLKVLDLSFNKINRIENLKTLMASLEELSCAGNNIRSLNNDAYPNLKILDLQYNSNLNEFTSKGFPSLQKLDLSNTKISRFEVPLNNRLTHVKLSPQTQLTVKVAETEVTIE